MIPPRIARTWQTLAAAALVLAGGLETVHATSNHTYGGNDFLVIGNGLAPSKAYSIAAHGEGDLGDENFHLYLFQEPGHKKIGPLEEVDEFLDTAPDAYGAAWSADSRYVALTYRSDRHVIASTFYRVENGRAFAVTGPSLVSEVLGSDVTNAEDFDLRSRSADVTWLTGTRFKLSESAVFKTDSSDVAGKAGAFGRSEPASDGDDGADAGVFVTFAAEAECEIGANDTYTVSGLKPGDLPPREQ